jgi:flagellin
MVSSILTNNGALTALQSLKATQKSLLNTQNRISTGLKVATAKDNAATWAVATSMRSDIANTKQVSENLSVSSSIIATAQTASETIADLVKEIRVKVTSANSPAVDKAQVQASIDDYLGQIGSIVNAASFKGVNLINSSGDLNVLTSVNSVGGVSTAAYANIAKQELTLETGGLLASLKDLTVLSRADEVMANQNDGVGKITYTVGAALALKAGNTVNIDYVDATDINRTLTVKLDKDVTDVAGLVTELNKDAGFSANFTAEAGSANTILKLGTKNRDSALRIGTLTSGAYSTANSLEVKIGTGTWAAGVGSSSLGLGALPGTGVAGGVTSTNMTFSDAPLELGDEFVLKVQNVQTAATGIHTYKMKVVSGAVSGDRIMDGSDPANGVYTIAIAAADVMNPNMTGKEIANVFAAAMILGSNASHWNTSELTGTAVADTSFAVTVNATTGTLSVTSATVTDDVLGFNTSATDFDVLLGKLDTAGTNVTNAAASFGTAATRIDLQKEFLDKLSDTLTTGLGALVDADMSEEAARLQALQVQEQLGTQALSIANQAPQSILSLFQ